MLYMIYGVDGPDADRIRAEQREAHFAYLAAHADILVLGGATLAEALTRLPKRPTYMICGMLNTKDIGGYLAPVAPHITALHAVSIPGEANTLPAATTAKAAEAVGMQAQTAETTAAALAQITAQEPAARVLICGSLYLAGHILRTHG